MKPEIGLKWIFYVLMVIVLMLSGIFLALKSLRCRDFSVQGDAQFFYTLGAHQLDGNDQDGKACESLRTPRAGTFYF